VFFDFRSTEVSAQAMRTLRQAAGDHKLPAACKQFVVTGHADTAEAATPDVRMDLARATAVRQALQELAV